MARYGLAIVRGRSMLPTLHDGDRLLVRYGAVPRPGDLVLVRLPADDSGARVPWRSSEPREGAVGMVGGARQPGRGGRLLDGGRARPTATSSPS